MQIESLGFSGSQHGMSDAQKQSIIDYFQFTQVTEAHHGDCIGADAEFHELVKSLKPTVQLIVHPPLADSKRAFCDGGLVLSPRDYLERNRLIVLSSDTLLATPFSMEVRRRSGTWYTIRYAIKLGKDIVVIDRNGQRYSKDHL